MSERLVDYPKHFTKNFFGVNAYKWGAESEVEKYNYQENSTINQRAGWPMGLSFLYGETLFPGAIRGVMREIYPERYSNIPNSSRWETAKALSSFTADWLSWGALLVVGYNTLRATGDIQTTLYSVALTKAATNGATHAGIDLFNGIRSRFAPRLERSE